METYVVSTSSLNSVNEEKPLNETLKTIYERRAVRKYKDKSVDRAIIEQIIDAGRMAPSAMNRQLWKFYVMTDKKQISSLSPVIVKLANKFLDLAHRMDSSKTSDIIFHNAPVVIFITVPGKNEWAAIDVGMCSQNMMLAAKSLGLDTCPIGFVKFLNKAKTDMALGISSSEEIKLALILGYGDEQPEVHERKKDNLKFING
jgi:nitroreductase